MNPRAKKILLLLLAGALLVGSGRFQKSLNHDRDTLGLTHAAVLENAPPMLAFTTVALGGFRGLISNFLWMRASDLQQDDKFFEAAQLADWITKLEPTFAAVWVFQGWNMAYNISVKFKDFPDRWRWVERGIELLRDEGLRYNPNSVDIYRELAWFFQHKLGANLDDAYMYYKSQEAHAIYWGARGLQVAKANPDKVKADDLIKLRRIIYQSMLQAFHHGRIMSSPFSKTYSLGPNLDLTPQVNAAYEQMMNDDAGMRDSIAKAHRNFLRDAVYFLYEDNRIDQAAKWFKYLGEKYPDKPIIDRQPDSLPKNLTLDEYAVAVVQTDIGETSQERVTAAVQGLLTRAYYDLATGNDDRYENLKRLAVRVYQRYFEKTAAAGGHERIPLPPFNVLNQSVVQHLLDPKGGVPYAARAALRTALRLPTEGDELLKKLDSTNPVDKSTTTNSPAQ